MVVVDRQRELADRTVEMITAEGGIAVGFAADVTDAEIPRDRRFCSRSVRRLDFLDNNVGIGSRGNVVEESRTHGAGSCKSTSTVCSLFQSGRFQQ